MTDNDFVAAVQMAQTELATAFNELIAKGYKADVVLAALAVTLGRACAVSAGGLREFDHLLNKSLDTVEAAATERWEERKQ